MIPKANLTKIINLGRCSLFLSWKSGIIGSIQGPAYEYYFNYDLSHFLNLFKFRTLFDDSNILIDFLDKFGVQNNISVTLFEALLSSGGFSGWKINIIPGRNFSILFGQNFLGIIHGQDNIGTKLIADYEKCISSQITTTKQSSTSAITIISTIKPTTNKTNVTSTKLPSLNLTTLFKQNTSGILYSFYFHSLDLSHCEKKNVTCIGVLTVASRDLRIWGGKNEGKINN